MHRIHLNCRKPKGHPGHIRWAFTLVELLVAVGIIGVLMGILLPVIARARAQQRDVNCASNMRQLAIALISYAGQSNGAFPTIASKTADYWYCESIIGPYISAPKSVGQAGDIPTGAAQSAGLAGGVFRCPDDQDDSVRSYSLNFFASGAVSPYFQKRLDGPTSPGQLFKLGANQSSQLILLVESWPELPIDGTSPTAYAAEAVVGVWGKPGERFGGGGGVHWKTPADGTPGRFGERASQITFYRHDRNSHPIEQASGRCNFAFLDGHVAMLDQSSLVATDGKSSYVALWSPVDREVENPPATQP